MRQIWKHVTKQNCISSTRRMMFKYFINGTHLSSLLCELLETDERDLHHERPTLTPC